MIAWKSIDHVLWCNHYVIMKLYVFYGSINSPPGAIDNKSALVQVMSWRRRGDKPLPEAQYWPSSHTHICGTRGRWVDSWIPCVLTVWHFHHWGPVRPVSVHGSTHKPHHCERWPVYVRNSPPTQPAAGMEHDIVGEKAANSEISILID